MPIEDLHNAHIHAVAHTTHTLAHTHTHTGLKSPVSGFYAKKDLDIFGGKVVKKVIGRGAWK